MSAPSTARTMSDLESGKKSMHVTVDSVGDSEKASPSPRPILGRRRTSGSTPDVTIDANKIVYAGDEDALTKLGHLLNQLHGASILTRYALYILPVAALLAIPLALFWTIYYDKTMIDHTRLVGLFLWIEVVWIGLWVCKLIAHTLPFVFQACCGLISSGIRKYSIILTSLEVPVSLFLWTIVAYGTSHVIEKFTVIDGTTSPAGHVDPWIETLRTVFKAGIIVAAIFLAEKTFIQLISINYHRKQYDDKIRESKKLIRLLDLLYETSRTIFPEFCKEFEDEDSDIQGNVLAEVNAKKENVRRLVRNMGRVRDQAAAAFGAMASDIAGKEMFSTTSAHAIVVEALETQRASKALARRLWLSFAKEGSDALYKHDLDILGADRGQEADEIFALLDRDRNGDVSLDEMEMLVVNAGLERKNRATSMHDISQAIAVLDNLLSLFVLLAIAFLYATFFSKAFASKTTTIWSSFTGLAFAIGGTVTEFLGCCIFLFVKHPYDVGDRVDIPSNNAELIVDRISLMYTVFLSVSSNKTVQIPHNVLNTLWIENVSRSKAMKERLTLSVAATTSNEDILALRSELEKFVTADDNRRDYQHDFDIELISVGNLSQLDLRVEIRHRSNFANELLRTHRRNKFMVELLAACRRIPIAPPGGADPPLGDLANPTYSVAINQFDAIAAKAKHDAEVESQRLFPAGTSPPAALSSALENPAIGMIPSITNRLLSVSSQGGLGGRRSMDTFRRPSMPYLPTL